MTQKPITFADFFERFAAFIRTSPLYVDERQSCLTKLGIFSTWQTAPTPLRWMGAMPSGTKLEYCLRRQGNDYDIKVIFYLPDGRVVRGQADNELNALAAATLQMIGEP